MRIVAKRSGTCGACGGAITPGQCIEWSRDPNWVITHSECPLDPKQPLRKVKQ